MTMVHRRFFVPGPNITGDRARITDEGDIDHIRSVLRLKKGDEIILLDGEGSEYRAILSSLNARVLYLELTIPPVIHPRPKTILALIQGLPKNPKMEIIIQKATELGITRITPVTTLRSVPIGKMENRFLRWQRIGREAASQAGRAYLPLIERPISLDRFLDGYLIRPRSLSILLWEDEKRVRLRDVLKIRLQNIRYRTWNIDSIDLFIGPEGGFSEEEVSGMKRKGILSCSLGQNLLRTETASLAALSIILYEFGQLG